MSDLDIPEGLSLEGQRAAVTILKVAQSKGMSYTGGCKLFYTPEHWAQRGERFGTKSHLIVVYDGGEFAEFFNHSYEQYGLIEEMRAALEREGLYIEPCTHWYGAVYSI
jgi:hypothetical protein